MADLLAYQSIHVGGWFGSTGESEPGDGVLTDGWYGDSGSTIEERLARLETVLALHKPIFINNNGQFEELDIFKE